MIYHPVPNILKEKDYIVPKLELYSDESIEVYESEHFFRNAGKNVKYYGLRAKFNGIWDNYMTYREDHKEGLEVYSFHDLSYGNVIITGLGFGVAENWISRKANVSSLKVIELNQGLIDYHKKFTSFNDKVELIHADATSYTGQCDVLLLDHYELPKEAVFAKIDEFMSISENISCKTVWAWRLENVIPTYEDYKAIRRVWGNLPDINKEKFELYKRLFRGYY